RCRYSRYRPRNAGQRHRTVLYDQEDRRGAGAWRLDLAGHPRRLRGDAVLCARTGWGNNRDNFPAARARTACAGGRILMRGVIVCVDAEPDLCAAAADWLGASGFLVATHTDPEKALETVDWVQCDCLVTDIRMPGISGIELLKRLNRIDADLPVIVL